MNRNWPLSNGSRRGSKVRAGNSSKQEIWQVSHYNISAKLKYPLPACTLTEKNCKSIMDPAIKVPPPWSGIPSNISTRIRDGTIGSGGGGVLSLFNYQCTFLTAMLVKQMNWETPTGLFLLQCIEYLTMDAWLYGPLWDMAFAIISKYITLYSLIFHTCQYIYDNDVTISVAHGEMGSQRAGEKPLMSITLQIFKEIKDIRSIQKVRLKL